MALEITVAETASSEQRKGPPTHTLVSGLRLGGRRWVRKFQLMDPVMSLICSPMRSPIKGESCSSIRRRFNALY